MPIEMFSASGVRLPRSCGKEFLKKTWKRKSIFLTWSLKRGGFYLRELFGSGLGTGDYGHLTVEHASMLLRNFRSLRHYGNQGFEAAHKLQKQIFSRATNHDGSGEATSLDQILTHQYAEKLLFLRLCFRNAVECTKEGKNFYFRGCG